MMQFYFAPMEGLTDCVYRKVHRKYFPGVSRYYTPFFSPTVHRKLTPKEARELPPANALDIPVIPQILTKVPADFLWMAEKCKELGYHEVNLNLGCPSGTVTAKGKGAGALCDRNALCRFLDEIYSHTPVSISVKTRLGFSDASEFPALLDIFNQYPVCELTVHPRVRNGFYSAPVDMDAFRYAAQNSKNPLCYNGNLNTLTDIGAFSKAYPNISAVMLGRGLIADPGMVSVGGTDKLVLERFCNELLDTYIQQFGNSRNAMFRSKELWHYLLCHFEDSEKLGKRLRKTTDITEYREIIAQIFQTLPFSPALHPNW